MALRRSVSLRYGGLIACGLTLLVLSGCASKIDPQGEENYATPLGTAMVTPNPTPYTPVLFCLASYAERNKLKAPRIAVGRILDLTGKLDENGGRTVTQGAMLMAISALGKAGVPVVERLETDVASLEYNLANNKLISTGDGRVDFGDYKPVYPGQVSGADFYITGGITELNANIRSSRFDFIASEQNGANRVGGTGGNSYVLNVALDVRMIDTNSLDVADMVSYQKQVIGKELSGGVFAFFGDNRISISAGGAGEEPVHLAVRSLVERAVAEMVGGLYGPQSNRECLDRMPDPFAGPTVRP